MLRTAGIVLVAVLVTIGAGWVWGASGRGDLDRALRAAEERAAFAESRALLLEARVSLFKTNFGDAGRALEQAASQITALQTRLRESGQAERAGRLEIVLASVRDAGRLTLALDPSAQTAAEAAVAALSAATSP